MTVEMFIFLFTVALIPALIAQSKGRSFILWYIYGVALLIIAIPHSLIISKSVDKKNEELKEQGYFDCPYCLEPIKKGAVVCPHCRRDIVIPEEKHEIPDGMKVCFNCGKEIKNDVKFCPYCHVRFH